MTENIQYYVPKIEDYRECLEIIRDKAYSNIDDDWIWIDDQTPLGLFIDSYIQRVQ